jgi:prevent-host-death family protein
MSIMTKLKAIHFSQARQKLSSIIDQVQKTGPVTILRHGKPTVVVISHDEYQEIRSTHKKAWRLAGSLTIPKGVDLDKALKQLSDQRAEQWRLSTERSAREFVKD